MRTIPRLLPVALTLVACPARSATNPPTLLGAPAPAAEAVPTPESTLAQAISEDGRWLLFSSANDRLTPPDHNRAADVFVLDLTTGERSLVSADAAGVAAGDTSMAGGLSADGRRAVFLSRASNLAGPDTNDTWDVFVRELPVGTTTLVSQTATGGNSPGPAADPLLSPDGRYVVLRSPDAALAPGGVFSTYNLYRRDLDEATTVCLTTSLPPDLAGTWRLTGFAVSSSADVLGMTAVAVWGAPGARAVIWQDVGTGQSRDCTASLPPELSGPTSPLHSAPAISADGRFVAFRSEMPPAGGASRYALSLHDVDLGTTTVLALRTNAVSGTDPSFPAGALEAQLSADGTWVAYATPTPRPPGGSPDQAPTLPFQVYLYDVQNQTTRLVSAASDGTTPANTAAVQPQLAADGRGVAFLSRATNLLAGFTDDQLRALWFERPTGTLTVVASLGDASPDDARLVLSPGGDWLVVSAPGTAGAPTFHVFDTRTLTANKVTVPPQLAESSTGRGWLGVRPTGASADGRYAGLTAFPPASDGDLTPMQVYLVDTVAGHRQLVTRSAAGAPADGHSTPPALSADGTRLLFVSGATNLVADDTNGVPDAFIQSIPAGERRLLRGSTWRSGAVAQAEALLSPDGRYAALGFLDLTRTAWQLVDTETGVFSPDLPGTVVDPPVFSGDGTHFAVSRTDGTSALPAAVEVYRTAAWLGGETDIPEPTWVSASPARVPTLGATGNRLAFFQTTTSSSPSLSTAVVVVDYVRNAVLWSNATRRATVSPPALSAEGRYVAWTAPGSGSNAVNQVWRGDVELGTQELVSVATDGSSQANGNSKSAVMSPDGRYIAFASLADNLVTDDGNGAKDVFLRDMKTGQTLLVSRTAGGTAGRGWSLQPFLSADGRSLFFLSHAPDFAARDANQAGDLFKVEILDEVGPLLVIQRNLSTGQAQLFWNGAPGKTYALESTDQIGGAWTRLPGEYPADAVVPVDTDEAVRRFYRVREL